MPSIHKPVLSHEVVEALSPALMGQKSPWFVDGTIGGCGHTRAIINTLSDKINILAIDRDLRAVENAKTLLQNEAEKLIVENESFRDLDIILARHDIRGVQAILFDLGISSDELETSGKGFSFQKDEPLYMTMDEPTRYPFTAKDIVNTWQEENIANIIYSYSEERFARKIAKAIVRYRVKAPINTTFELAEIIKYAVPPFYRRGKIHPATKTFQALRITVNDELNALKDGLKKGYESLGEHGRMAVISFHSLEDRIVKEYFRTLPTDAAKIITRKPIVATEDERCENPRSRSAKLRIIEKIGQSE